MLIVRDGRATIYFRGCGENSPAVMKALNGAGHSGWAISEQPANQAANVETAHDLAQQMDRIFAIPAARDRLGGISRTLCPHDHRRLNINSVYKAKERVTQSLRQKLEALAEQQG